MAWSVSGHAALLAAAGVDLGAGRLEALLLDDELVQAGRERERHRRLAVAAEVLAVEVDRRPRRLAGHGEERDARGELPELLGGRLVRWRRGAVGVVVLVGGVVVTERLVGARDVEDDVPVGRQAVRGEKLEERLVVAALLVELGAVTKARLGLVGAGVGARQRDGTENDEGERGGRAEAQAIGPP